MPSGGKARFHANVAALTTLRDLAGAPANTEQQHILAGWSSWGALPQIFDEADTEWATERAILKDLLDERAWDQARRTTINAHFTDPAYVAAIWDALKRLGFPGGDVLEPGCGSGTFIGMAPPEASMTGVELDATTAAIAAALYPAARIRAESFADTRFPRDSFTATVGNVPFGDVRLHDPVFNPHRLSMHNHFIVKAVQLTRPGGMVAVLTSAFTMDARNPAARRAINADADLVGAIRLPTGAHHRAAGTDALTDLLILRRRVPGQPPADNDWELTTTQPADGGIVHINTYFAAHPERILGTLTVGSGMYGQNTVKVLHPDQHRIATDLRAALDIVVDQALEAGEVFSQQPATPAPQVQQTTRADTDLWDGTLVAPTHAGEPFRFAHNGQLVDLKVPPGHETELRQLLQLRDLAVTLLEMEAATGDDTPGLDAHRTQLRQAYRAYVDQYGPINRYDERSTGRTRTPTDPTTAQPDPSPEPIMARITPTAVRHLRTDPHGPLVLALEIFDEATRTASPAGLLTGRVLAARPTIDGADTPAEAAAISLDRTGTLDLDLIAHLLGVDPQTARTELGELAYNDPATNQLIPAAEYCSGDVRAKLQIATEAAETDPAYQVNVAALTAVLPDPIAVEDITARMGAVWIAPEIHERFLAELLNDHTVEVENPMPGHWIVTGARHTVASTSLWGTQRMPAPKVAEHLMTQRPVVVRDTVEDAQGRTLSVVNPVETTAAQAKAEAMSERFAEWVWEDPARAAELATEYNTRFNSLVLRDYAPAGAHLTLPGLAATITLRPHQRTAVARMICEPTVGLFHEVGAGKTLEMVVGATELRRLGLIRKPAVVVPNHMLAQFAREWLQAYPNARLLAASAEDLAGEQRRLFVARAAANDWDAIILTQEALKRIPVSPQFQADYLAEELAERRRDIERANATLASRSTIKVIEKAALRAEEAIKRTLDTPHDPGITWEKTGIDYLLVDEAHTYKNLATPSNIPEAAIPGSRQATDLHMKLEYLRRTHGNRVACLATATPLANSITEAYVMQRYLRPDLLQRAGLKSFDSWAATFAAMVTDMEMGPAGGFRLKTRFATFQNVPEMLRLWAVPADVQTAADLKLPVPQLAPRPSDGRRAPQTIVVQPTPEMCDYIHELGARAEAVSSRAVDARTDNMLLISTDGRKAALDMRLVAPGTQPTGPTKLDAVASTVLTHWAATSGTRYRDATGQESPIPGGLQLVFSDLGTPNAGAWNAYSELKAKLIAGGIPESQIRFIHDAKTNADKERLFTAARAGHVRVLIGSTSKMGVGTNIQSRVTALHHIDCPWRPADVQQREGRAIRQGNQNPEVAIYRYVVEGSFDGYSWQTVTRKSRFIEQVMTGRGGLRQIEDIGDTTLSAAEAKALASGNPLLLLKATADNRHQQLRRQQQAHQRGQAALRHTHQDLTQRIDTTTANIARLQQATTVTVDTSGDRFAAVIAGVRHTNRAEAAHALLEELHQQRWLWHTPRAEPTPIANLGGHTVTIRTGWDPRGNLSPIIALQDVPLSESTHKLTEIDTAGPGLIRTLENKITAIHANLTRQTAQLAHLQTELQQATQRLDQPFPHAQALADAQHEVQRLDQALAELHTPPQPTPEAPPPNPPAASVDLRSAAFPQPATASTSPPRPPTRRDRRVGKDAAALTAGRGM